MAVYSHSFGDCYTRHSTQILERYTLISYPHKDTKYTNLTCHRHISPNHPVCWSRSASSHAWYSRMVCIAPVRHTVIHFFPLNWPVHGLHPLSGGQLNEICQAQSVFLGYFCWISILASPSSAINSSRHVYSSKSFCKLPSFKSTSPLHLPSQELPRPRDTALIHQCTCGRTLTAWSRTPNCMGIFYL